MCCASRAGRSMVCSAPMAQANDAHHYPGGDSDQNHRHGTGLGGGYRCQSAPAARQYRHYPAGAQYRCLLHPARDAERWPDCSACRATNATDTPDIGLSERPMPARFPAAWRRLLIGKDSINRRAGADSPPPGSMALRQRASGSRSVSSMPAARRSSSPRITPKKRRYRDRIAGHSGTIIEEDTATLLGAGSNRGADGHEVPQACPSTADMRELEGWSQITYSPDRTNTAAILAAIKAAGSPHRCDDGRTKPRGCPRSHPPRLIGAALRDWLPLSGIVFD